MYGAIAMFPVIAAVAAAICIPFWLIRKKQGLPVPAARKVAVYAFVGMLLMLVFATILWGGITLNPQWHFLNLTPFSWCRETYEMGWNRMTEQLILNVMMFVPLGLLVPMVFQRKRRFWRTCLTALSCTVAIETVQYFIGRSADIDDVIMNFLGAVLGYGLFALAHRLFSGRTLWREALGIFSPPVSPASLPPEA